ncbi:hypothetical protein [Candidatus Mesenet endosymbiont of Phosphuga atrata]|uniref:hypothetical protein n=1 Tax=Candidatus Mesenet endosymbiont of Phosphuga atrata TaxID=3066221 RepID=UPI0030CA5C62
MSQILDDLKKGFKAVDEFYTNKIREPVVNLIKSCNKVFKLAKHNDTSHDDNEHMIKTAFEQNESTFNQVSAAEDLTGTSINDTDIL